MEQNSVTKKEKSIQATIPEKQFYIPVKFNKEVRNLRPEEAAVLSQKGLKYDAVSKLYDRLKAFAVADGVTVTQFLDNLYNERTLKRLNQLTEECGGNSKMAEHILALEEQKEAVLKGEDEFSSFFPNKSVEDLPQEVLESAKQNNSSILDAFLRYKTKEHLETLKQQQKNKENKMSAVGSLKTADDTDLSPEREEFLKGLWG